MSTTLLVDGMTGRATDAELASSTPDTTGHAYDAAIDAGITVDSGHIVRFGNVAGSAFNWPSLTAAIGQSLSADYAPVQTININGSPGTSGIAMIIGDGADVHSVTAYIWKGDNKIYVSSDVTSEVGVAVGTFGGNAVDGDHTMSWHVNAGSGTVDFYWDDVFVRSVAFTSAGGDKVLSYSLSNNAGFGVVSVSWVDAAAALLAPTGLAFGTITPTAVPFTFTDPNTPQANAYQFRYSLNSDMSDPSSPIDIDGDGTIDPVALGLAADEDYYGQVRISDPSVTAWCTAELFHTAIGTLAITTPTLVSVSSSSITATVHAATGGDGDYTYDLLRNGVLYQADVATGSQTIAGYASGTSGDFTVRVTDGVDAIASATLTATTTCAAPTGVSASPRDGGAIVTWSSVTGAVTYNIYVDGVLAQSGLTSTAYALTGLTNNVQVAITVKAIGSNSQLSTASAAVNVTPRVRAASRAAAFIACYRVLQTQTASRR